MFQFPGCPPMRLWIHLMVTGHYPRRVSPFGYPRLNACLRIPEAFRSLPRPSSAISAMASTLRSCSLDLFPLVLPPASVEPAGFRTIRSVSSMFRLSLCSFQGALEVRRFRSDPSKRYSLRSFEAFQSVYLAGLAGSFRHPLPRTIDLGLRGRFPLPLFSLERR